MSVSPNHLARNNSTYFRSGKVSMRKVSLFSLNSCFSLLIFLFYIQQMCKVPAFCQALYQATFLRQAQFGGKEFAWKALQ